MADTSSLPSLRYSILPLLHVISLPGNSFPDEDKGRTGKYAGYPCSCSCGKKGESRCRFQKVPAIHSFDLELIPDLSLLFCIVAVAHDWDLCHFIFQLFPFVC